LSQGPILHVLSTLKDHITHTTYTPLRISSTWPWCWYTY